jgi:hypothetical protein
MVSNMESDAHPGSALAAAERATAAIWTDYPPTPAWYYPAGGAWVAAFVAVGAAVERPLVALPAALALTLVGVAFTRWYTRYRGVLPRLASAPAEFRPAIRVYLAGCVLLTVAVIGVTYLADRLVAGIVLAFVGTTAALYLYERAYEAAARRTRDRLG